MLQCRSLMPVIDVYKRQIENLDLDTLYEVPLALEEEGLAKVVCNRLGLEDRKPQLDDWTKMVDVVKDLMNGGKEEVTISLVGKYVSLHDAYILSLIHILCRI